MAEEDVLAQSASVTAQMVPKEKDLTSFGPTPMVQPPPLPRMQMQPQQFAKAGNEFQTVSGRKRADRQALISNTVNLIKSGSDYIQARKQRDLSMTIERLIGAQEGLTEAQASGDKEAMQKNAAIINDITSDPKKAKQLQKAFNIDLFGNGKNKNENMALQEAMKNYQKEKQTNPAALNPIAQKMMAAQPQRVQLSPEAQAQAMAIKAGIVPKAGEILKAYQENFKVLMTSKTSEDRNATLEKAAQLRAQAQLYHADKLIDAANIRVGGQEATAEINSRTRKYVAQMTASTWDKRLAKMDEWAKMKTGDSPVFKKLTTEAKTYNDRLKELSTENSKLQTELDKKGSSIFGIKFGAAKDADAKMMRQKIMINNFEMQQMQQNLDGVTKKMQLMDSMGIVNIKELSAGSSGGSGDGNDSGNDDDAIDTGE